MNGLFKRLLSINQSREPRIVSSDIRVANRKKDQDYWILSQDENVGLPAPFNVINNSDGIEAEEVDSASEDEHEFDYLTTKQPMTVKRQGSYNVRQDFESSYEELVESKNRLRKLRIIIGVVTTIILAILLAVGIYLVVDGDSNGGSEPNQADSKLALEDILEGNFAALRFNASIHEGGILFKDVQGNLLEYDIAKAAIKLLVPKEVQLSSLSMVHEKSPDGKYLLVAKIHAKSPLYFAKWSTTGNALLLNSKNNLYYKPSVQASEIQLTNDDKLNVLNGRPDWVYEEEIFSSNTAAWFNPAGTKVAYIRFDDSSTRSINLSYYGTPGDLHYQYPLESVVYYPKAGSSNPLVELHQVDVADPSRNQRIRVSPALAPEEHLITAVTWLNNDNLLAVFMNRIQNEAYIQITQSAGNSYEILSLKSKTGWVDLFTPPHKNKEGSKVALILPQDQGLNTGEFRHIAILGTNRNPDNPVFLTNGKFVVQQILFWDQDSDVIYYSANTEESPRALHIYGVRAQRGEKSQCLTCSIKVNGVQQTYFSADFDRNGKYVAITSQGPDLPETNVYEYSFVNNNLSVKKLMGWEVNSDVRRSLLKIDLPKPSFHNIELGNGFSAQVMLLLPPNADLSGKTKYPMLVDVYGGPDSYSVVDRWSLDWGSYLASNHSVIYAKIDGRGSGLRGEKLLHSVYLKLGTVEIDDQIETARKLTETLPYIDGTRIGIWGWSYGGYAAAMALAKDNQSVFKCATSVAPVTDWAYYDSIYTERYMNLPSVNPKGYENASLTKIATKLNGKQYMLIHGTLDDNVHYQQAMVLAKVLEQNDIMFKQISYPDEDHGLNHVRPHLYHSLDKFFKECLKWN